MISYNLHMYDGHLFYVNIETIDIDVYDENFSQTGLLLDARKWNGLIEGNRGQLGQMDLIFRVPTSFYLYGGILKSL